VQLRQARVEFLVGVVADHHDQVAVRPHVGQIGRSMPGKIQSVPASPRDAASVHPGTGMGAGGCGGYGAELVPVSGATRDRAELAVQTNTTRATDS
jgi:hypothetical protein